MGPPLRVGIDLSPIWRPSVASDRTVAEGFLHGLVTGDEDRASVVIALDQHAPADLPPDLASFEIVRFRSGPLLFSNPTTLHAAYRRANAAAGLFHHFGPFRRGLPAVTLVHDLLNLTDPAAFGPVERRYLGLSHVSIQRSSRVLCPSRNTAAEIVRHGYRPSDATIDIVTWGASAPHPVAPRAPSVLEGFDRPFALSVGRITERKRIPLAAAIASASSVADRLVVAGPIESTSIADRLARLDHVDVLGRVAPDELEWLYRNAAATLLTSRSEGFGLPIVEALQRGCPVLCTDLPVFREIAGDLPGVAFFDDHGDDCLADAGSRLDLLTAQDRPDPGAVSARFTWAGATTTLLKSLRRAATDS